MKDWKQGIKGITAVLAVLSVLIIIVFSGKTCIFPGSLSLTVSGASVMDNSEAGSVLIDKNYQRVMILDSGGNCREVLEAGFKSGKEGFYSAAAIGKNDLWLAEPELAAGTSYYDTERIVRYDLNSQKKETVFEITHTDEDRTMNTVIKDFVISDSTGVAVCVNARLRTVYLITFPLTGSNTQYETHELTAAFDDPVEAWFVSSNPNILIVRSQQNVFCTIDLTTGKANVIQAPDGLSTEKLIFADLDSNGNLRAVTQSSLDGMVIPFSAGRKTMQILFWVSLGYLFCLLVFLLGRGIISLLKNKNFKAVGGILGAGIAVFFCVFIIGFYSMQTMEKHLTLSQEKMEGYCTVLYACNSSLIDECLTDYRSDGMIDPSLIRSLEDYFENSVHKLAGIGDGLNFSLVGIGEDGQSIILLCDSSSGAVTGEKLSQIEDPKSHMEKLALFQGQGISVVTCAYPLLDQHGNLLGAIAAYQYEGIYVNDLRSDFVDRTVLLLSILITVGFILVEAKAFVAGFRKRKEMRLAGIQHEETALVRPLTFLLYLTSSVNTTLLVIIIKEMAAGTAFAQNSVLIALPLSVYSFGYVLGAPVRKLMMKRLPEKWILLLSAIISALSYFVCFLSVNSGNIPLFTLAIFISNTFITVLTTYTQELSFYSKSIGESNSSISAAKISGSSISGILAGFFASKFGNASIELLGMMAALASLVFIWFFLPGKINLGAVTAHGNTSSDKKLDRGGIRALVSDPLILAVLLCMIVPVNLFNGYKSFLFPYVASESGISKATISDIVVFCNALVFFTASLRKGGTGKSSNLTRMVLCCGGISMVFMLFLLNSSIQWAVIALAAAAVANKTADPLINTFWQERVLQIHGDKQDAQILTTCVDNFASTVRSTFLGFLMQLLGFAGICFTCGAIGAVGVASFTAVVKKVSKKDKGTDSEAEQKKGQ